jgi:hypothetical protein
MQPYIGITGFMTHDEARYAHARFHNLGLGLLGYRMMIGVLASSKTLAGLPNKWPGRYPPVERIESIWPYTNESLNLIHYATDDPDTLGRQLRRLIDLAGPGLGGFQFNVRWPDVSALREVAEFTNVLQVGRGAMAQYEFEPRAVADRLAEYEGVVSGVLLDTSGGRGEIADEAVVVPILREILDRGFTVNVGVAGGLSVKTMALLVPFLAVYPRLSIDAEGRLRDGADCLNLDAVEDYLRAAGVLLARHARTA